MTDMATVILTLTFMENFERFDAICEIIFGKGKVV